MEIPGNISMKKTILHGFFSFFKANFKTLCMPAWSKPNDSHWGSVGAPDIVKRQKRAVTFAEVQLSRLVLPRDVVDPRAVVISQLEARSGRLHFNHDTTITPWRSAELLGLNGSVWSCRGCRVRWLTPWNHDQSGFPKPPGRLYEDSPRPPGQSRRSPGTQKEGEQWQTRDVPHDRSRFLSRPSGRSFSR